MFSTQIRVGGYGTTSYSSGICRMYYSLMDSVKFSWESYQYGRVGRITLNLRMLMDMLNYLSVELCSLRVIIL